MPIKNYIINITDIVIEVGLITLIIFMPLFYGSVEVWSQATFELCILFIFLIWILKVCGSGELTIYKNKLDLPILIFFILVIISRFTSIYPHLSQLALYRITAYLLLYFILVNNFITFSKLERLVLYIVTMGTIISFIGIIGYFNKNILLSLWPYASFSTFTTTSHFAGYIGIIFPLSLAMSPYSNMRKKTYFIFSSAVIATSVLFCQDRGGWVQFLSAVISLIIFINFSGFLKRKWLTLLFVLILVIWAVSFYGFQPIIKRLEPIFTLQFGSSPEATIWQRWIYWKDTLRMIKSHPFFGTGIGTFSIAYPLFRSPEVVNLVNYAHQDFLQLASEMGLVGLAVFAWILLAFFKLGLNIIKTKIASSRKMQIAGSLAGVFGLLVYSFYDFNLHIPSNAVAFIILFATVPAFLISQDSVIKNKFQINLKLNFFSRIVIFLISIYFITFIAISIIKPHLAYLHYEKGQVFEEGLEWDKAIEEYNEAKRLDPTDSSYYYALGKIYTARAQFEFLDRDYIELAINNYNKAIRLNPQQGEYYLALGIFYNILGNKELASDNLNKALSLDPTNQYYHSAFDILLNK